MSLTETEIVDRLARIETKLDQTTDLRVKVERLERFLWLALGMSLASGGSQLASLVR